MKEETFLALILEENTYKWLLSSEKYSLQTGGHGGIQTTAVIWAASRVLMDGC